MKIQFLYFDDCPNSEPAYQNLVRALQELHWQPEIEKILVQDDLQAEYNSFQGSPSIKLDGTDLWEEKRLEYHLGCRVYKTPTGLAGSPTVVMIVDRLKEISNSL